MKKYLLAIISMIIFISCTNVDTIRKENDIPNGYSQGKYNEAGKRNGEWYGISNDNIVTYVAYYNNGVPYGDYTTYYRNGKVKERGKYSNDGRKIGDWIEYYENGGISKLTHYYSNGEIESILYRKDGKISETRRVIDDKISGLTYKYDEDGKFVGRDSFGVE
ncbi:MAG: hypothetical protein MJH09_09355 [Cetobacterium sp.]|nr:hypothetical protein [Cetobacterium sp.]